MSIHRNHRGYGLARTMERPGLLLGTAALTIAIALLCFANSAGGLDISDAPMDTKVMSAPPNIMFVLDNSGSMDWEYMIEGADQGLFEGEYYVFDDPGDNAYSGNILSGADRGKIKAQMCAFNKLYYNPKVDYKPWPNMDDANTSTPRSNPNNATPTFDLTAEYFTIGNESIADDQDPVFSHTGSWGQASNAEAYNGLYYWTNANDQDVTAVWYTPLAGGEYEVYARYFSNSYRSTAVPYTIFNQGGPTIVNVNQRLNGGTWFPLGTFTFEESAGGTVGIFTYVGDNNTERVCGDSIKFVPTTGADVSIKNAHYYTWDDNDEDGEMDAGENVYLVNFVNGVREHYWFHDRNENHVVEGGELFPVDDVPHFAKAAFYDEDGIFIEYKTDAEDLQNFANWYSYYRRRELTAKAAVSHAIMSLVGVQVGFYSINTGLRQPVLPVKLNVPDPGGSTIVIVDNKDSGYQETGGRWYESGAHNEYKNSSRYTSYTGRYATWTPNLPEAGEYRVYAWWDYYSTRDTNALYKVYHNGGTYSVRKNQKQNYSKWSLLGTFNFDAGTSGKVQVYRDGSSTGNSTSADAVMFESTAVASGGMVYVDETDTLLNALYGMDSNGGTPLRLAVKNVGRYFHQDDGNSGGLGDSPYMSAEEGGACQHSFCIAMTDGYWNGSDPGVGNQDGTVGPPYADSNSDTLADVAMKYYKEDLSDSLDDVVPTSSCDKASHQHMVTYSVSFGVQGSLDHTAYHPCLLNGGTPPWPDPTTNCYACDYKIDDLWHAAVNGRGLFFSASDPGQLISALEQVMQNIASRMASGASVTVNGEELGTNTVLYQSSYVSDGWIGDVTAYPVDPVSGEILKEENDLLWKASDELQDMTPDQRKIVVYDGTSEGAPFRFANLTDDQKTALDPNWETDSTVAENMVDYLRGEEIDGFRPRVKKLGDIVHSAPLLTEETIFAGGNDGMLHAFNAADGIERFAYVPHLTFENLKELTNNDYEHKFFVDRTPYARKKVTIGINEGRTLLVGGLGKGGKGYFALDITDVDTVEAATEEATVADMVVLWEYPRAGVDDPDLGYTYSYPYIVKSCDPSNEWVVIFGNGYDSTEGEAILYVMDVYGNVVKKIYTLATGNNGLSTPALIDVDKDFKVDYAYAGDLKGNLWKFDLTSEDPVNWDVAFKDEESIPQPLFRAPGQPITTTPDVMKHCERHGHMVVFGTGKFLGDTDRADVTTQTLFGIWDYADTDDAKEYLGSFSRETIPRLNNQPDTVSLLEQTVIHETYLGDHYLRVLSDHEAVWITEEDTDTGNPMPNPSSTAENHAGWYFDLPLAGERIIRELMIRDGRVVALSIVPNESPCSGGGDSLVHELDACDGSRLDQAAFDINDDGVIDDNDLIDIGLTDAEGNPIPVPPTGMDFPGMLYAPVMVRMPDNEREMKIFSTSAGATETVFEVAEERGVFYWRERRTDGTDEYYYETTQ
ncbi:MAG: PilC/PilY family type IV pilus protein [Thermodesulfobacteriota bacterium]|nr:PilC/PilY family type IV pilus protein [Thermodesulfobacteriota bacterium]